MKSAAALTLFLGVQAHNELSVHAEETPENKQSSDSKVQNVSEDRAPELEDKQIELKTEVNSAEATPSSEKDTAEEEVKNDSLTVSQLQDLNNSEETVTVDGYVTGYVVSKKNVSREELKDTNLAIADQLGETNPEKMAFVEIPKKLRKEFGLSVNPSLLDKKLRITGKNRKYYSHHGIKSPSEIIILDESGQPAPAPEVELSSIADARKKETGKAKVKGIVTSRLKNTIAIQDETAGIAVRPTSLDLKVGDEVVLEGSLQNYRGLLQLDGAKIIEKVSSENEVKPKELQALELPDHQSELVTIKKFEIVKVNKGDGWANYSAKDKNGTPFIIRDERGTLNLSKGLYDQVTGNVSTFNKEQQIIPSQASDIIKDVSQVRPVVASAGSGMIPQGTEIELSTQTPNAKIYYTTDGSEPTDSSNEYTEPIKIDKPMTLKAVAYAPDLKVSEVSEFNYTVYDATHGLRIHHIQGAGHESPLNGARVEDVEGIVTYIYDIRGANYFHMQTPEKYYDDNDHTSEGIVVYTGKKENIKIGDLVRVTGTVNEYHIDGYNEKEKTDLSVTQINARNDQGGKIDIVSSDNKLPEAIKITSSMIPKDISSESTFKAFEPEKYAIDFWESIEGMRVEVAPSRAVAPQEHGDLVVVTEDFPKDKLTFNGGILLTPEGPNGKSIQFKVQPNDKARGLKVKTGDLFTKPLSGVVNYGFGNYKVYADLEDVKAAHKEVAENREQTTIVKDENKLTIAAYNVENFAASSKQTSEEKLANIARAFVQDMQSPDIIGIVEVMANDGQESKTSDASKSYQRLIDGIMAAGGPQYKFLNIDPEYNKDGGAPGGNIRVGYLYNPERVSVVDAPKGQANQQVSYVNGRLTLNPGRITSESFKGTRKPLVAQFEFKGERIVVINNHLNSKRGDTPYFGQTQPPVMGSEPKRHQLASEVNNFIKEILADNPEANIVALGDMNDFQFSKTLDILAGDEMHKLINDVELNQRYTYVYQGNSQVLDHLLVSKNLADKAEIDIIHVNADYTNMHGRASDHEPVLAQIDLRKDESNQFTKVASFEEEVIPYETERRENSELAEGEERIVQEGKNGKRVTPITIFKDLKGNEIKREVSGEPIITESIHEIIEYGTKVAETDDEKEKYYFNVKYDDGTKEFTSILENVSATSADKAFKAYFSEKHPEYILNIVSVEGNRFNYKATKKSDEQSEEPTELVFKLKVETVNTRISTEYSAEIAEQAEKYFRNYVNENGLGNLTWSYEPTTLTFTATDGNKFDEEEFTEEDDKVDFPIFEDHEFKEDGKVDFPIFEDHDFKEEDDKVDFPIFEDHDFKEEDGKVDFPIFEDHEFKDDKEEKNPDLKPGKEPEKEPEKEKPDNQSEKKPEDNQQTEDEPKLEKALVEFLNADGTVYKTFEAKIGDTIIVPEGPAKDGYKFLYWEGSVYYPGDELKVSQKMKKLTAKYEKVSAQQGSSSTEEVKDDKLSDESKSTQQEKQKVNESNQEERQEKLPNSGMVNIPFVGIGALLTGLGSALIGRKRQ